ncbi:MAG: CIA30 family protein [Spirochaetia bacterium]|nr:CIA30 family protein [Spirochaetia bacterium]
MEARAVESYPGFSHRRLLVLAPEYLLVFDRIESLDGAVHRYDWVYHNAGNSFEAPGLSPGKVFENVPGLEYAKNVRRGKSPEILEGNFPGEKISTRLILHGGSEVLAADGPLGSIEERIPFVMARKESKNAEFLAVIEPVPAGNPSSIESVQFKNENSVIHIAVKRKGGEDLCRLDAGDFSFQREGRNVLSGKFKTLAPPPPVKLKKNILVEDFENASPATFDKTANVTGYAIADSGDADRRKTLQFSGNFSSTPYVYVRKNLSAEKIQKEEVQGIRLWVRANAPLTLGVNVSYQDAGKEVRYSSRISVTAKWNEVFIPLKSFRREDQGLSLEELRKMSWVFFVLSKGKEGESVSIDDLGYY